MATKRRAKNARKARTGSSVTEKQVPLAVVAVGIVLIAVSGAMNAGPEGAVEAILVAHGMATVNVLFALGACFLTAKLMGVSFGLVGPACLKLTAVCVILTGLSMLMPWIGWFFGLVLDAVLLMWFFEPELLEVFVLATVILLMRWLLVILAVMGSA